MKVLNIWDEHDYDPGWRRFVRKASRAVIPAGGGRIAMIKSHREGFYKFPGGGLKPGETTLDALVRETREEAGLVIIPSTVEELGLFREVRKSVYDREIFDQRSYYFRAQTEDRILPQRLENYEKRLGFRLEFIDAEEAYLRNAEAAKSLRNNNFLNRETWMLKNILENGTASD